MDVVLLAVLSVALGLAGLVLALPFAMAAYRASVGPLEDRGIPLCLLITVGYHSPSYEDVAKAHLETQRLLASLRKEKEA